MNNVSVRKRIAVLVVGFAVAVGCSGGGCSSCSCMEPLPDGFPAAQRIENAIQLRLTGRAPGQAEGDEPRSGIDFFERRIGTLVRGSVDELAFPIDTQDLAGVGTLCDCGGADCGCRINLDIRDSDPPAPPAMELVPEPRPDGASLRVARLELAVTSTQMPLDLPLASCTVTINSARGSRPYVLVSGNLAFTMDGQSGRAHVAFEDMAVDLEGDDIEVSGGIFCRGVGFLVPFFERFIEDAVAGQVGQAEEQLYLSCDPVAPACPQDGDGVEEPCAAAGYCVAPSGQPEQALGTEGAIRPVAAFLDAARRPELDLHAWLGGYAAAENDGLTLGMWGGFDAPAHDPCVPERERPPLDPVARTVDLSGNTFLGEPFHVGIGISKRFLDAAGFSAYDSGTLCLTIGQNLAGVGGFLSSSTIDLFVNLDHIVYGRDPAPMALLFRPREAPTFEIGEGRIEYDDRGRAVIADPLITVRMPDLHMDLYAFADERWLRLLTFVTDLALPIALDLSTPGQLLPVIGDLDDAFTSLRVENSELLFETRQDLEMTFPTLFEVVGAVLPSFLGEPFALPDIQGFVLRDAIARGIDAGQGVEPGEGAFQALGIFASLGVPEEGMALSYAVDTTLDLIEVSSGPTGSFRAGSDPQVRVRLALGGRARPGEPLEWQVSVDGGPWSPFHRPRDGRLDLDDAIFRLQGRHVVRARAREIAAPETLDPAPAEVEVLVDTVAPDLVAEPGTDGVLVVAARDAVSPPEALSVAWTLDDGSGPRRQEVAGASAELQVPAAFATLAVEATDEAGNVARRRFHGRLPAPPDSGCNCALGARAPGPPVAIAIALAAALSLFARSLRGPRRARSLAPHAR